jgi:hypothetical protein
MDKLAPSLSQGVEAAIGKFIANFSLLEAYLRGIIVEAPNVSAPAGEIITSEISFRGLINVFGAVVHEYCRDKETIKLTKKVLKDIEKINVFRNSIVHSQWLPDDYSHAYAVQASVKANRKKGYQERIQRLKRGDLLKKCDEVARLTYSLSKIYERIMIEQGAKG